MRTRKTPPPSVKGVVFYNRQQVAEQLGVSVYTVSRLVRSGALSAVRVGQQLRFPETAIDSYVASRQTGADS